jgi:alpha-glucosidase (family GH31 glycosyl hydrolase)
MPGLHRALPLLLVAALVAFAYACNDGEHLKLTSSGTTLRFASPDAAVIVEREPFRLSLTTASGTILAGQQAGALGWREGERTVTLGNVVESDRSGRTLRLDVESGGETSTVALTWRTDRTLEVELEPPDGTVATDFSDAYTLAAGEVIYGLSERVQPPGEESVPGLPPASELDPQETGSLDRRGEVVEMYVQPTMAIYAPFYHSSNGYGLYVEGFTPGRFDVGAAEQNTLRFEFETGTTDESGRLTYNLFAGDHGTIVDEYTALTGRPFVPPSWAFLNWRWRDELPLGDTATAQGVEMNAWVADDINSYQTYGIPAGVYMIDRPWSPGDFGFNRFEWDPERLPNAEEMLDALDNLGYHVALWTSLWAMGGAPDDNGTEAVESGYLAPGSDRIIDLTNPEAWTWWEAKQIDFADTWDIAALKLDRGEELIPSEVTDIWADGRTGREVHNEYVVMQMHLMFAAMSKARGADFVVISRAGYTGAQQYGIFWGGDSPGSTLLGAGPGTDLGLRNAIISLQRAGFMGFPIWGSDTGGYYEFKDRDVFARWLQFSAFTPLMEIGGQGTHAPWDMPTEPNVDDEMIAIYKKYVQLHHDLLAYTEAHAAIAGETGLPIARALVFDFPDDPQVRDLWDEFMYGPDLLVAPVWRSGERSREVYLPAGEWQDFWDRSTTYQGPTTISVDAPLDTIPVFIRAGAELPPTAEP